MATRPESVRTPAQEATRLGLLTAVGAYTLWGLFPLFLKLLDAVSATEILGHRIVWAVPFGALLISARGQWPEIRKIFSSPRVLALLAVSALVIAVNWLIYVWAVGADRVLEASLGYYINPLMNVAAGVVLLGDQLRRLQIVAVVLAAIGVIVLTVGGGVFPWVSFVLAVSFTAYGFIRKTVDAGAMPGLFTEVVLLAPLAITYLFWIAGRGESMFATGDLGLTGLLILAGPVTVVPLLLFALAARRLTLTTLGFIQYIGPTLQFLLGLAYGEPFTVYHAICFGLIWTALAVFSFDAYRRSKAEGAANAA